VTRNCLCPFSARDERQSEVVVEGGCCYLYLLNGVVLVLHSSRKRGFSLNRSALILRERPLYYL
jgi:hypothetical protein